MSLRLSRHITSTSLQYMSKRRKMAPAYTKPSEIPTLVDLYHAKKLPEPDEPSKYQPDAKLNARVSIWRGDITKLESDMIVNAANKSLLGGGGVDGAIHRAAGDELYDECKTLGGADIGETKVTMAYNLPSQRIAHTVGPIYTMFTPRGASQKLQSCYKSSLELCAKHGGGSIGFSSISTGIYGYPIVEATRVALETTRKFLENDNSVTRVIYVVFSEKDEKVYRSLASEFFPHADASNQPDEPAEPISSRKAAKQAVTEAKTQEVEPDDEEEEEIPFPPSSQATVVGDAQDLDKKVVYVTNITDTSENTSDTAGSGQAEVVDGGDEKEGSEAVKEAKQAKEDKLVKQADGVEQAKEVSELDDTKKANEAAPDEPATPAIDPEEERIKAKEEEKGHAADEAETAQNEQSEGEKNENSATEETAEDNDDDDWEKVPAPKK